MGREIKKKRIWMVRGKKDEQEPDRAEMIGMPDCRHGHAYRNRGSDSQSLIEVQ